MANKIILKRSSVAGKIPLAADLDVGEIAVNLTDKKLYSKDAGGVVVQLCDTTAIFGDVKDGFQTVDHSGWIKLDGRAKSTLNANQQSRATALGIGANLPNANNVVAIQNGSAVGTVSGSMSKTILQSNLPNITLSAASSGSHQHWNADQWRLTDVQGSHSHEQNVSAQNGASGWSRSDYVTEGGSTGIYPQGIYTAASGNHQHWYNSGGYASDVSGTHTHQVPLGGSGTALDVTPASLSINKFIYLGT